MIYECKRIMDYHGITAKALLSNPDCVPTELGVYDGIIIGWNCYSHIIGSKSRTNFLTQLYKHIKIGGPILISFYSTDKKSSCHYWISKIANIIQFIKFSKERLEVGDRIDQHVSHIFTEEEIERELL